MKNLSLIIALLISCQTAIAEFVTLTNSAGQSIEAEILDLKNNMVKIRRSDGKEFSMRFSTLDQKSKTIVHDQIKKLAANPSNIPAKDLVTMFKLKRVKTEETDRRGINGKTTHSKIGIELRYAGGRKVNDIKLEYRVYYSTEKIGSTSSKNKRDKLISGSHPGLTLTPGETTTVFTKEVKLTEFKVKSGWSYGSNKAEKHSKDVITGRWIRLYDGNKMIYEYSKPDNLKDKKDWGRSSR